MDEPVSNSSDDQRADVPAEATDPYRAPQEVPAERGFGKKSVLGLVLGVVVLAVVGLSMTFLLFRTTVVPEISGFGMDRGPIEEWDRSDVTVIQPESVDSGAVDSDTVVDGGSSGDSGPVVP